MDHLFRHPPSPVQEISCPEGAERPVRILVKRDDLLAWEPGSAFQGNKWRKLQYNLLAARQQEHNHLLTFGGAYSNHIAAVAAAGRHFGFRTTGIIRGEEHRPLNPTLRYAADCGMHLRYLDRTTYRQKMESGFLDALQQQYGPFYLLPEGGTNALALKGCADLVAETGQQFNGALPDYWCVACGTGGTLAGLIAGLQGRSRALGFPVLRGDWMRKEIAGLLDQFYPDDGFGNWEIQPGYHFGGYARHRPELLQFIRNFKQNHGILLDPVYTGKLFYGVLALAEKGYFPPGSSVLIVHTGGQQGIAGFEQRFGPLFTP